MSFLFLLFFISISFVHACPEITYSQLINILEREKDRGRFSKDTFFTFPPNPKVWNFNEDFDFNIGAQFNIFGELYPQKQTYNYHFYPHVQTLPNMNSSIIASPSLNSKIQITRKEIIKLTPNIPCKYLLKMYFTDGTKYMGKDHEKYVPIYFTIN